MCLVQRFLKLFLTTVFEKIKNIILVFIEFTLHFMNFLCFSFFQRKKSDNQTDTFYSYCFLKQKTI